jgi:hypothetical protein
MTPLVEENSENEQLVGVRHSSEDYELPTKDFNLNKTEASGNASHSFATIKTGRVPSDAEDFDGQHHGKIKPFKFSWTKLMSFVGPGFLMSIAYLDPGNIAGDLEAGIAGGYALIWTLLYATALGWFFQIMAARIGVVTQRNLARVCAEQYSMRTRYTLWIMTEFAIIGSDI